MTVEEAAKQLECSAALVYKLCGKGEIGYTRIGFGRGKIMITDGDLSEYLELRRVHPTPEVDPGPSVAQRVKRPTVKDYYAEWKRKKLAR